MATIVRAEIEARICQSHINVIKRLCDGDRHSEEARSRVTVETLEDLADVLTGAGYEW